MNRSIILCGILCGAVLGLVILSVVAGGTSGSRGPKFAERAAHASGAIETAEDAIDLTLDWIPPGQNPHDAIARLVPGYVVGHLLHSCLSWDNETPFWVVAVYTDATWEFGLEDYTVDYIDAATSPKHPDAEGIYSVIYANLGKQVSFGDLINDNATNTYGLPSYDDVANLDDEELTIAFETPQYDEGGPTADGTTTPPTPNRAATALAIRLAELNCREEWWPDWATFTPAPTSTSTPTRTPTPCVGPGC